MKEVKLRYLRLQTGEIEKKAYELEAFLMVNELIHPPLYLDDDEWLYIGQEKADELNYVKKDVAFPTEKQLGYIGWCCALTEDEKKIITSHKNDGTPNTKTDLEKFLGRKCGLECAPPIIRDAKDAPTDPKCADEDNWEDDIPF
jgi:hypothetical protein